MEFSPFEGQRLAVATAQYFGIVGNGRLHVVDQVDHGNPLRGEMQEVINNTQFRVHLQEYVHILLLTNNLLLKAAREVRDVIGAEVTL